MSEPKDSRVSGELRCASFGGQCLEYFDEDSRLVRQEFDDIVSAGLASTPYQQTDDTSARVAGKFWHTHILCNPFYAAYFTPTAKRSADGTRNPAKHERFAFSVGVRRKHWSLLRTEFDIPRNGNELSKRLAMTECGKTSLAGVAPGMVRPWQPAGANRHRTGGSDCVLPAPDFRAGRRDHRV